MAKTRSLGFNNRAFNLPDNAIPPTCDEGAIWTNLTLEELYVCLGGGARSIPHSGYERCGLTKSADQLVAKQTWVDITFDQEDYNIGEIHSNTVNNERITLSKPGYYLIALQINWESSKDDDFQARIYKNGDTLLKGTCVFSPKDGVDICVNTAIFVSLAANDYITLQGYQGSDGNKNARLERTFLMLGRVF